MRSSIIIIVACLQISDVSQNINFYRLKLMSILRLFLSQWMSGCQYFKMWFFCIRASTVFSTKMATKYILNLNARLEN